MSENEKLIERIVEITYQCIKEAANIPVGVSNKHVHLQREHLDILFGKGYELTKKKMLGQPGQYASEETVKLIGPKGTFSKVRILGPLRKESQVEISKTDCFILGINAPVRESGKLKGTPGVIMEGPKGTVEITEGVIVPKRHIHLTPPIAELLNAHDGELVSVDVKGERGCLINEVLVRVSETAGEEMHIDTDEANAFGLKNKDQIQIYR